MNRKAGLSLTRFLNLQQLKADADSKAIGLNRGRTK